MDTPYIHKLQEAKSYLKQKGYNVFYIALRGSQNYGIETRSSDFDYVAVTVPSWKELADESAAKNHEVHFENGHIDVYDIRRFMGLLNKANPAMIEAIATPNYIGGRYEVSLVRQLLYEIFVMKRRGIAAACRGQAYGFHKKYKESVSEESPHIYDGKSMAHLYRMWWYMKQLKSTGYFEFYLPEDARKQALAYKTCKVPCTEIGADVYLRDIEDAFDVVSRTNHKDLEVASANTIVGLILRNTLMNEVSV